MIIGKQRNGKIGSALMRYIPNFTLFTDPDDLMMSQIAAADEPPDNPGQKEEDDLPF
jgi:hypothetical protein